uniref:Protein krueppel n=1 Tax=Clastoptera arizonana TaxID=38151 RepID=A0A1B6EEN7_9HEMI
MDIHSESTSGFQSEIEIQNNLSESIIPTTFELNSHLNSSAILESSYRTILVPNIENFCRMCGNEMEFKDLILIFGPKGFELEIPKKISNFLQIQILQDDGLPQQMCLSCIYQLNICQQLVLTCQEADVKLRHIFQVIKTSKETTIELPNSTEDHQILNNINVEPEGLTDSTHTLEEMKILLEKNEASKKFPEESNGNSFQKDPDVKVTKAGEESDSNKGNQKPEMFLCDLCGKNFSHDVNLRTHKRTHLAESLKKKHHCTLCTKSFRSKFFLSEHMNMHKDLCPYSCSDCNKKFHKRTQLRQHKKTHLSDSQKVVCEVCGMKFSRRGNLMQHIKTHGKDRTFICRVCKEEFNTLNLLLSHRKLHTQEDIKNRIVLGEHKKENIHSCEICGKVFFKKSSFIYHVRNHKEQSDDNVKWKSNATHKNTW